MCKNRQLGAILHQHRFGKLNEEDAKASMLSISNWLAEANAHAMSTTSKVLLGLSVVLTLSTVTAVHLQQTWDRQVGHS